MSNHILIKLEPLVTSIPLVYKNPLANHSVGGFTNDKIPHKVEHDFYKLGRTIDSNMSRFNIPITNKYLIEGVVTSQGNNTKSFVSLLSFDYMYITTVITDVNGNYKFDYIPFNSYIIVAEDLSCEYNHSIQVGVKPVEIL